METQQKIKLDDMNNSHTSNGNVPYNQWLYHELGKVQLFIEDKNTIINGRRLNDKHVSFGQNVLKFQFSEIEGLKPTSYPSRKVQI